MTNLIFRRLHSSLQVIELFEDSAIIQSMLDVECALAYGLAELKICKQSHSKSIEKKCKVSHFDLPRLAEAAAEHGTVVVPLVKDLTKLVNSLDPEASIYVHYGITSQDVIDTALILQLVKAFEHIKLDILSVREALERLTKENKTTLMLGRTLMQPSAPITFAQKVNGWLFAINNDWERLEREANIAFSIQMGGAVGNLSAFGKNANNLRELCAKKLKLRNSGNSWHVYRNNLLSYCSAVAMLVGSLGKIAKDVSLLMQPEVGEVKLAEGAQKGSSSAMPHKKNPVGCLVALASVSRGSGLMSTLFSALPHEHERALGGWQQEWMSVPQIMEVAAGSAKAMSETCKVLSPNTKKMRHNLDILNGVIMSERLMLVLSEKLGKVEAKEIVAQACERAQEQNTQLSDILASDKRLTDILSMSELDRLLDPSDYLGSASFK